MADPGGTQVSYEEIASVLEALPIVLREHRRARRLSLRAAAKQIGVSFATVSRVEAGDDCILSSAIAMLRWADQQAVAPDQESAN